MIPTSMAMVVGSKLVTRFRGSSLEGYSARENFLGVAIGL